MNGYLSSDFLTLTFLTTKIENSIWDLKFVNLIEPINEISNNISDG